MKNSMSVRNSSHIIPLLISVDERLSLLDEKVQETAKYT